MIKLGELLAIIALGMLLASFSFWPAATKQSRGVPSKDEPAISKTIERGKALFLAKGCATCHRHDGLEKSGQVAIGPNLSHYRPNPAASRARDSIFASSGLPRGATQLPPTHRTGSKSSHSAALSGPIPPVGQKWH